MRAIHSPVFTLIFVKAQLCSDEKVWPPCTDMRVDRSGVTEEPSLVVLANGRNRVREVHRGLNKSCMTTLINVAYRTRVLASLAPPLRPITMLFKG